MTAEEELEEFFAGKQYIRNKAGLFFRWSKRLKRAEINMISTPNRWDRTSIDTDSVVHSWKEYKDKDPIILIELQEYEDIVTELMLIKGATL